MIAQKGSDLLLRKQRQTPAARAHRSCNLLRRAGPCRLVSGACLRKITPPRSNATLQACAAVNRVIRPVAASLSPNSAAIDALDSWKVPPFGKFWSIPSRRRRLQSVADLSLLFARGRVRSQVTGKHRNQRSSGCSIPTRAKARGGQARCASPVSSARRFKSGQQFGLPSDL